MGHRRGTLLKKKGSQPKAKADVLSTQSREKTRAPDAVTKVLDSSYVTKSISFYALSQSYWGFLSLVAKTTLNKRTEIVASKSPGFQLIHFAHKEVSRVF